jgi:hypothetical protein
MDSRKLRVVYEAVSPSHEAYRDLIRLLASWADKCRAKLRSASPAKQATQDTQCEDLVDHHQPAIIISTINPTHERSEGAALTGRRPGRPRIPADIVQIHAMRAAGHSLRQISRATGTSKTRVSAILKVPL